MAKTAIPTGMPTEITTAVSTETSTELMPDAQRLIDADAENGDPTLRAEGEAVEADGSLDDVPEKPLCEIKFTVKQDDLLKVLTAFSVRSTLSVLLEILNSGSQLRWSFP